MVCSYAPPSRSTAGTSSRARATGCTVCSTVPRTPSRRPWSVSAPSLPSPGALPVPLRAQMGLHTGAAEERDGDYFGPALSAPQLPIDRGIGARGCQDSADLNSESLVGEY
jgi:hypothetical protein